MENEKEYTSKDMKPIKMVCAQCGTELLYTSVDNGSVILTEVAPCTSCIEFVVGLAD